MDVQEHKMPKEVQAVTTPHFTEEESEKIAAFFKELAEGKTCPHCHNPITELYQVGRCVYNRGCHCRQYQGVVPKDKRTKADQKQIDEASMWCPLEDDEEGNEP